MDLQLFINDAPIDIDINLIAPLTYSVADVKSPEKRSRNRSKSVRIKGTANNMAVMYPTYSLSLQDTGAGFDFNPNTELSARIIRNGYIIFNGVAQFEEAVKKKGTWSFSYKLFGNSIGLFEKLGDKTLADLGWSEYDHALTIANLQLTWDTSVDVNGVPTSNFTAGNPDGFGYIYPLINWGYAAVQTHVKTNELIPYFYMKEAFEKCFSEGDYTLIGGWIDDAYTKQIIFGKGGGERITLTSGEVAARECTYTVAGSDSEALTPNNVGNLVSYPFSRIYYISDVSPFTITINTDSRTQMDETNGRVTIGSTGSYNIDFNLNFDYTLNYTGGSAVTEKSRGFIRMSILVNGADAGTSVVEVFDGATENKTITIQKYLLAGDEVRYSAQFYLPANLNYVTGVTAANAPTLNWGFVMNSGALDITSINAELLEGDTVGIGRWLPDMKCRDFVNSIITMFNLYMSDPNDDDEIRIEPFEDYYLGTDEADNYTMMLDHSKDVTVKSNAGIEGKVYNFNWKEDMDGYHQYYKDRWGTNYGDLEFKIPSTFKKGEKNYKVDFAQTIPIQVGDLVIPQVVKRDQLSGVESVHKGKPRIMSYNGLKTGAWNLLNSTTNAATTNANYPQAHHVDDITTPTKDLNFGIPNEVYYTATSYTTNNLFAQHYDVQIKELTSSDSKFLEAYFKINESHLQGEFMRTLVNINGVTYRKNLINDFDATGFETTRMELIKVLEPDARQNKTVTYIDPSGGATNNLRLTNEPSNYTFTTTASGTIQRTSPNFFISDTSAGAKTAVLSWEIPYGGEKTIMRIGANIVTVTASASDGTTPLISGEGSVVLLNDYDVATFTRDEDSGWILKSYTSLFKLLGGQNVETITATQTADLDVDTYFVDTTSGDVVLTLPTADTKSGKTWNVKKIVAANKLTITPASGTIDGSVSAVVTIINTTLTPQFDGTNFKII